jgi:predicted metal-dependent HD superfamily phosphohydrolase
MPVYNQFMIPAAPLNTGWQQLLQQYTSQQPLIDEGFNMITAHYNEVSRHYHNLQHLQTLLHLQQQYAGIITDNDSLLFAVFFHDIIYDVQQNDNEEQSAAVAAQFLQRIAYPPTHIDKVVQYIIATKSHLNLNNDVDLDYFLDFDLAVLSAPAPVYQTYALQIRQEYDVYPDILYKPGRKKVLQHFLQLPAIYKTVAFREQYEAAARRNMLEELKSLE